MNDAIGLTEKNPLPVYPAREKNALIPILILSAAFVIMLAWTWFKWPDPIVDFGRELYVPWQLAEGRVLYRDIAYFNGPLSPYFNSLVMRILGVSLRSIAIVNIAILAAVILMLYRLALYTGDALGATLACLLVITTFSFMQLGVIGNYNFITPYSHELTHGIALSVAALLCLARFIHTRRTVWVCGAGLLLGLIFLTKPEVFVAAGGALGLGLLVALRSQRATFRHAMQIVIQFLGSTIVAPAIALALLMIPLGPGDAARGVLGGWLYLFDPRVNQMKFYQRVFGSLDLATSAHGVITNAVWYTALAGVVTAGALALRAPRFRSTAVTFVSLILTAIAMAGVYQIRDLSWQRAFRGLSIVLIAIEIALVFWMLRDARTSMKIEPRAIMRFALSTFALLLLAKTFFNALLYHYGFALTMPAAFVTVLAMASWGPRILDGMGGSENFARGAAIAVVGFVIFVHLRVYHLYFSAHPIALGEGADRFFASDAPPPRAVAVRTMLDALAKLPPNATLATMPEGAMLNYLSRRPNPTPYINLMPPEVVMFGQDRILRAFQAHPPDYIVYVLGSDAGDYGFKGFDVDYGRRIFQWVKSNYQPVPGAPREPEYPLVLLRRN